LTNVIARTAPQRCTHRTIKINGQKHYLHNIISHLSEDSLFSIDDEYPDEEFMSHDVNKIFRFDVDLHDHPSRAASQRWQEEVHAERVRLYGEDDDYNINALIALVFLEKLKSLMQRID